MQLIDPTRACYRVLAVNGFFGPDDTLYTVDVNGDPAVIYYDGEPNEELEPLNQLAVERLTKHLEKLDRLAREASEKLGRPFVGRPRNLDGAISLATELQRQNISMMGMKNKDTSGIERVEAESVPETGGKKRRGRPPSNIPLSKAS